MTNAASITINDLTANDFTLQPAGDVLDTGTVAVTLYGTVDTKRAGRVLIEVQNLAGSALAVDVLPGDNPPAFRAGLGTVQGTVAGTAGTAVKIFGPFETARFLQDDGTIGVKFTPTDGTVNAKVRAYALPEV